MQLGFEDAEARNKMWAFLIPGYQEANRNTKKKLKSEYKKMYHLNIIDNIIPTDVKYETICSFGDCEAQAPNPAPTCSDKRAARKGNVNMYVEQNMTVKEKTTEDVRREHFLSELGSIHMKKVTDLRVKFGIDVAKRPTTPKELVEWIKAGDYTFIKSYDPDDEEETWCKYESPIHGFRWTKVKEDRKGYDAARETLDAEKSKFVNEIWAEIEPSNFIKILEKFEKAKLH